MEIVIEHSCFSTKKEAYIVKMAYNAVRKQFRVIADQVRVA